LRKGFFRSTLDSPNKVLFANSPFICNLSNFTLSKPEISLLEKGLTFIPSIKKTYTQIYWDALTRLTRRLLLKDHFDRNNTDEYFGEIKKFVPVSRWTPPLWRARTETQECIRNLNDATNKILTDCKIDDKFTRVHDTKNLSTDEKRAMHSLRNNPNLIIKPADKGGATVLLNKSVYLLEAERQLNNTKFYKRLDGPIHQENTKKLNDILMAMYHEGYLTDKNLKYLWANDNAKNRTFYLLPKVHKARNSWPHTNMPAGRPIVSDCGTECANICEYIDYWLAPLATKHKAYLKDTYDFVEKIRGMPTHPDDLIISGDISSLYTNMNIGRILRIVKIAFIRSKPRFPERPDAHLLELLRLTLTANDFEFNGQWYLQIWGCAMGKKYAPHLADLFLLYFDEKATKWEQIKTYYRFLDDIFIRWRGTRHDLKEYENYLNKLINSIEITLNIHSFGTEFLDTFVYKHVEMGQCTLQTRVFFKTMDTHQLLFGTSFHPKHTHSGIIKSQMIRFKTICSNKNEFEWACKTLFETLKGRHYSLRMLRKIKNEIWYNYDPTVKILQQLDNTEVWPIVIHSDSVGRALATKWRSELQTLELLKDCRMVTAFKIHPNLRHYFIRAKFSLEGPNPNRNPDPIPILNPNVNPIPHPHPDPNPIFDTNQSRDKKFKGCRRCPNTKCKACNYITESNFFTSSQNKRVFNIAHNFTCKSKNICYLITCRKCAKQYVGETGRSLSARITDHLSCIRLKKPTPIGLHFNQPGHTTQDLSILPIDQAEDTDNAQNSRRLKETYWQKLLQTAHPLGINFLQTEHVQ